jgi:hypothetical protein
VTVEQRSDQDVNLPVGRIVTKAVAAPSVAIVVTTVPASLVHRSGGGRHEAKTEATATSVGGAVEE